GPRSGRLFARAPHRQRGGQTEGRRQKQLGTPHHSTSWRPINGASTSARRSSPGTKFTWQTPNTERSFSAVTTIGPADGAVPGAGWGNAVDRAVWNATCPSTFC